MQQYKSTTILKRTSAIKVATINITDDFHYKWKPSCAYHNFNTLEKDKWDTKEGTGKSMKNVQQKAPLGLK